MSYFRTFIAATVTATASNNIQIRNRGPKMEAPATPSTTGPAAATTTAAAAAAAPATVPPLASPSATTAATGARPSYPPPASLELSIEQLTAKIGELEQKEERVERALSGGPAYFHFTEPADLLPQLTLIREEKVEYLRERAALKEEQQKNHDSRMSSTDSAAGEFRAGISD